MAKRDRKGQGPGRGPRAEQEAAEDRLRGASPPADVELGGDERDTLVGVPVIARQPPRPGDEAPVHLPEDLAEGLRARGHRQDAGGPEEATRPSGGLGSSTIELRGEDLLIVEETGPDAAAAAAVATTGELDLNPDGGLDGLHDLRERGASTSPRAEVPPRALRDPNEVRLDRMLRAERLVYGVESPYIGRREDLERLYNAVRDAVNTPGLRTVSVVARPGLGKTRLMAEMFAIVEPSQRGIEVSSATCSESEAPEGLDVLSQLVRRRFGLAPGDDDATARDKIARGVEPLVDPVSLPTATKLLGALAGLVVTGRSTTQLRLEDPAVFHDHAVETWVNLMRYDAGRHPQVIVFHRAEHMTPRASRVFGMLVDSLAALPVVLVFLGTGPMPVPVASPRHLALELDELGATDLERLARAILTRMDDVPQGLVDDLVARSGGNPGVLEDNIRLLVQKGVLETGKDRWRFHPGRLTTPIDLAATLEGASRARMAALSPKLRAALSMASVFGPSFWLRGVLAMMRTQPYVGQKELVPWVHDRLEQRLNKLLLDARRADLIVFHSRSSLREEVEFSFVHREDRARLYDELPSDDRALYHRMAAQWLAARPDAEGRRWHEAIADHYSLGGRSDLAATYLLKAARAACRVFAYDGARELLRQGLSLVNLDAAELLCDLAESHGDASLAVGAYAEARRMYGAFLEATLVDADRPRGARAWCKLARAFRGLSDYDRATPCLDHAQRLYREEQDAAGLASVLEERGRLVLLRGLPDAVETARRDLQEALAARRGLGDEQAVASSLTLLGELYLRMGQAARAESALLEALVSRRQVGARASEARALLGLGRVRWVREDTSGALEAWRRGLDLAEVAGARPVAAELLCDLGHAHTRERAFQQATTALHEARSVANEMGDRRAAGRVFVRLALLARARGDWTGGMEHVGRALDVARGCAARGVVAEALRAKAQLLGTQLYSDDTQPGAEAGEAARCFREALGIFEASGEVLELREKLLQFAEHLQERGGLAAAKKLRGRAAQLAPT